MERMRTPAGWCLRFLSGAVKGRTIALHSGANVVGSASECDVMLPGGEVMPRHAVFTVGDLVVTLQRLGTATARLNGRELGANRRNVVAGDVVLLGKLEVQLDRVYAADEPQDSMFALPGSILPEADLPASRPRPRRALAADGAVAASGALAIGAWALVGGEPAALTRTAPNLAAVETVLARFPEVEVLATPGGSYSVKGYVESRERRRELERVLQPFGTQLAVSVHAADEIVEHAHRYLGDPALSVAYAGQGRLVVSGTVDDEAVRRKVRQLGEDLHPAVLVTDKVVYLAKARPGGDAAHAAAWAAWQQMLPARMVSITDDGRGLRYIQLANGSRYYEGSLLRSGAELRRIEPDGLVVRGALHPEEPVR